MSLHVCGGGKGRGDCVGRYVQGGKRGRERGCACVFGDLYRTKRTQRSEKVTSTKNTQAASGVGFKISPPRHFFGRTGTCVALTSFPEQDK